MSCRPIVASAEGYAKKAIWESDHNPDAPTCCFPLEPLCIFLGRNKLTSDKGDMLWFWVQKQFAGHDSMRLTYYMASSSTRWTGKWYMER